jgi:Uncharacterized protein contain chitin-binding domain type 3
MSSRYPDRQFSFRRLLVALVLVLLVALATAAGLLYRQAASQPSASPWFGGYVDVTATPSYQFESPGAGVSQSNVLLSFIVAQDNSCTPSWGGYYTLDEAADELDLDRRIAQVGRSGRTAAVSFGGRDGTELAAACPDAESLAAAYKEVLERYDLSVIDLDIEGGALTDSASRARQAEAVGSLTAAAEAAGSHLSVWLTLPADSSGLTADGLGVVQEFLDAGVVPTGVNLMTMNFGDASADTDLPDLVGASLVSAHDQLLRLLVTSGTVVTPAHVWSMMGATVMIGQSDLAGEVLTTSDAEEIADLADDHDLARMSLWSLNRDYQCPANYADWATPSTSCSGVTQQDLQFSTIFSSRRSGSADAPSGVGTSPSAVPSASSATSDEDDPATSPYSIWNATTVYAESERVVWHHNVYVARWKNQGNEPDLIDHSSDQESPWRLVGPVLAGETPHPVPTLTPGALGSWDPDTVYHRGDRVMLGGTGYEAKWWTQGDSPEAAAVDADSSPWRELTDDEVREIQNQ